MGSKLARRHVEDLEREVPHREDDDEGDQGGEDQNHDLLEPFVEAQQTTPRALDEILLACTASSSFIQTANRPPDSDAQRRRHGAFADGRGDSLDRACLTSPAANTPGILVSR